MNQRRRLTGSVKSTKMDKTVIVEISRTFQHPLYRKVVRSNKSYKAHDELNCQVGDQVVIVESAPISATVRWVVERIIRADQQQAETPATETVAEN